jgi:hypothetical protein
VPSFECSFIEGDVTKLDSLVSEKFNVIIYTYALEHLDREGAIISLKQAANALKMVHCIFQLQELLRDIQIRYNSNSIFN